MLRHHRDWRSWRVRQRRRGRRAPPSEPTLAEGATTQLITEEYLRRQLDENTLRLLAPLLAQLFFDKHVEIVSAHIVSTWDKNPVGWITVRPRYWRGSPLRIQVQFYGPNYDATDGGVVVGKCSERPGAGVKTTGEFTTIDNGSSNPILHRVEKTVSETYDESITLTESFQLSSGVTIEAGTDIAKVSATLEATFGISTETTQDHSTTTSVTVADDAEVDPAQVLAISFTTDNNAVDCHVDIKASGDWGRLTVIPPADIPHKGDTFCDWSRTDGDFKLLSHTDNGRIITRSDAMSKSCTLQLDDADDLVRIVSGYAVSCVFCDNLAFGPTALAATETFSDAEFRHISFSGTRHSATHKDASYKALDVTGQDMTCVEEQLSKAGRSFDDLDTDGDGVLDACGKGD